VKDRLAELNKQEKEEAEEKIDFVIPDKKLCFLE
jgi:hypothetical protein